MGQAQVEAQAVLAGLSVLLGEQLQEAAHPIFHPAQSEQGDQGLGLTGAADQGQHQGAGQMGGLLDLLHRQAEQIAIAQGRGLVEVQIAEGLAEGFIRTGNSQENIFSLLIHRAQLDHAARHQPNVVAQHRHAATGGQGDQIAPLKGVFEHSAKTRGTARRENHGAVCSGVQWNVWRPTGAATKAG